MKPSPFAYHEPRSLVEAVELFSTLPNPRLLAGGQSLVPMLNFRIASPDHLIDLNGIDALRGIELLPDIVSVGAMTTQRSLEHSEVLQKHCPLLSVAVQHVGHQQTRNRGTLGGSLCHLDPAAELPVAAAALDPVMVAMGPGGERRLCFSDFSAGYLSNTLQSDEILVRVEFPRLPAGGRVAFVEIARRPADFAIVSVAVQVVLAPGDIVADARIAIGGLTAAPVRLTKAEVALTGRRLDDKSIAEAREIATELDGDGDSLNPAEYRKHLAGVLTVRALQRTAQKDVANA
jgi:aerobic carbon-monoxide dehydrogenase medium subunit